MKRCKSRRRSLGTAVLNVAAAGSGTERSSREYSVLGVADEFCPTEHMYREEKMSALANKMLAP